MLDMFIGVCDGGEFIFAIHFAIRAFLQRVCKWSMSIDT